MNAHFEQLDLVLGQQVAVLTAVKNWLPRKIELIKKHRLGELEAFVKREDEQVTRLIQAESQRLVLLGLLARDFELATPPSMSQLILLAPPAFAEKLQVRQQQLSTLALQIKGGQHTVNELLRVSMDYVHYSLDIFAQLAMAAPATGYGREGVAAPNSVSSFMVNRTA